MTARTDLVAWFDDLRRDDVARVGGKNAPSNHPEFAEFLVACGIDSISVSPSSFIPVKTRVAAAER
ncbi:MAG TPA: hypothetical protein VMO81_01715 [Aestuariivirgaceae bacterium]|nr:hypothetical protein [Aestuariivirgaceae bacterium]